MKILVSTSSFGKFDKGPIELLESHGIEVILNPYKRQLKKEESLELYKDIDGVIAGTEKIDSEVVMLAEKLKVVSRLGAGIDNVDQKALESRDIPMYYTPYGPTQAVAEFALGMILSALRTIPQHDAKMKKGTWEKKMGNLLQSKTVGIIGLGRIGKKLVEFLKPFGVEILAYDKFFDKDFMLQNSIQQVTLDEILVKSDIISMHLPYHESMKNMIHASSFDLMKEDAILVNLSRGGLVDENALYDALSSNKIRGAAFDVFSEEPYSGRLSELDNIILTPHVASSAVEARINMEYESAHNLLKGLGVTKND